MIVIVGGGIAGLASALALAPLMDVVVLERRGALASNEGAGIQLSPNAMKALRALGVEDRVRPIAHRPQGLSVCSGTRRITRVAYDAAFEARFGAPSLTASRAALHRALLAAALDQPRITLVADRPVERVQRSGAGWSLPGPGGGVEGARWLVAADGVNSAVRREVAGDGPTDTGWVAWRGRGVAGTGADTTLTMAPGRHLVRYAMSGTDGGPATNLVYVARADETEPGQRANALSAQLRAGAEWLPWPIHVRERHCFHAPALAFVGDAAHAMRPYLAQGAAMALEDAAVLGHAAATHGVSDHALAAYANARAKRVRRVADMSHRQGGVYHMSPPLSFARDLAMGRLGADGILSRVGWIYEFAAAAGA